VEGLAAVAIQVAEVMKSEAEKRSLLEQTLGYVNRCADQATETPELRAWRKKIMTVLDPESAMRETVEEIQRILAEGGQSPAAGKPSGGQSGGAPQ